MKLGEEELRSMRKYGVLGGSGSQYETKVSKLELRWQYRAQENSLELRVASYCRNILSLSALTLLYSMRGKNNFLCFMLFGEERIFQLLVK